MDGGPRGVIVVVMLSGKSRPWSFNGFNVGWPPSWFFKEVARVALRSISNQDFRTTKLR